MSSNNKKELCYITIGAALFAIAYVASKIFSGLTPYAALIFIVPYVVVGGDVLLSAAHGLIAGQLLDENLLMSIASLGAFLIGEHPEAVMVMLLYRVGELLQSIAVGKSRDAVSKLIDICPERVYIETENGIEEVLPDEVHAGDVFVVRAGDRVPIDGTVVEGSSSVNTAALTGESIPVDVKAGDKLIAGSINSSGLLRVRAECEYEESTAAKMLALVEEAAANKSKSEKFITKFARIYTPSVVVLAVLLAAIPSLFFGGEWKEHIYRALNFLVISCPCALVISVPLTFFGGIGAASKNGILVKGSNCLEALAKCDTVVFDKTGTLTKGIFHISKIVPEQGVSERELMYKAAAAEQFSTHPLAECVLKAYENAYLSTILNPTNVNETAGLGVKVDIDGKTIRSGNQKLMAEVGIAVEDDAGAATTIHIAENEKYLGRIEIEDEIKEGSLQAINSLREQHHIKSIMLSGDRKKTAERIGETLALDGVFAELLPKDKVSSLESIIRASKKGKTTAYVGDGINDAPVIAMADVGLAMGALGSDAAIAAADIVLADDDPRRVSMAIGIAKRTVGIAWQNITFALVVKAVVMLLGALGYAELWMAIAADVGVCILSVINAIRAMNTR